MTTHQVQDVISAEDRAWMGNDWGDIDGAERYRRYEARILSGRDASAGLNPEAFRTLRATDAGATARTYVVDAVDPYAAIHDLFKPDAQRKAVLDMVDPHSVMRERQRGGGLLPGEQHASDAANAGVEVLDLSHPHQAAQR